MKAIFLFACFSGLTVAASAADVVPIRYAVSFKGEIVATQTVSIVQSGGVTTLSSAFSADLPVFVAHHQYSEQLAVSFRSDGAVVSLDAARNDGSARTLVSGTLQSNGLLQVVREDMDGVSTNGIAREDYDFHSLILYGTAPTNFLSTNHPQRVLSVAEGRVALVDVQLISESDTFERQHLVSPHLIWTEGDHVSHSWHPERFSNLPRRYIRRTDNGEFTFELLR